VSQERVRSGFGASQAPQAGDRPKGLPDCHTIQEPLGRRSQKASLSDSGGLSESEREGENEGADDAPDRAKGGCANDAKSPPAHAVFTGSSLPVAERKRR
jgi:hypothetical protein